jgi:hypothetical protein
MTNGERFSKDNEFEKRHCNGNTCAVVTVCVMKNVKARRF